MKARLAAAVEANRDEILDLSHRIHANPEVAYEERQAAAWVAEELTQHGYEVETPAGTLDDRDPGDAPRRSRRRTVHGSGSSPSTTPCPVWVTAAATTRWPRRASAPRSR